MLQELSHEASFMERKNVFDCVCHMRCKMMQTEFQFQEKKKKKLEIAFCCEITLYNEVRKSTSVFLSLQ